MGRGFVSTCMTTLAEPLPVQHRPLARSALASRLLPLQLASLCQGMIVTQVGVVHRHDKDISEPVIAAWVTEWRTIPDPSRSTCRCGFASSRKIVAAAAPMRRVSLLMMWELRWTVAPRSASHDSWRRERLRGQLRRWVSWTMVVSPSALPMVLRSAALSGTMWVPSPMGRSVAWNGWPS